MKISSIRELAIKQDLKEGRCPDDCPWRNNNGFRDGFCDYCDYLDNLEADEGDRKHDEKIDRELEC